MPAAAAAAFLAVVIVGLVASLTFWHQAAKERDHAMLAERGQSLERERAEESLRIAQAINTLLHDMLSAGELKRLRGYDFTVLDLVDAAAKRASDGVLRDTPIVQAAVYATIGGAYRALNRPDKAETYLRYALDTLRREYGDVNEEVAEILHDLANVLLQKGDLLQAEALAREALEMDRAVFGDIHENVAIAMHNLATTLRNQQRVQEAEPLYRDALTMFRELGETEHRGMADALNAHAVCLKELGDYEAAEPLQRESVRLYERLQLADHPDGLVARINLGHLLMLMGEPDQAEPHLLAVLESQRRLLPADHWELGVTLITLGAAQVTLGRAAEAEPLLRECLAIRRKHLPEHWLIGNTESVLGGCLAAQGRFDEAEPLLVNGYEMMSNQPYSPPRRMHEAVERLVELYHDWDRPEQADKWRNILGEIEVP